MHRTLAHRLRTLASAGLLLLLSACMLVDDFSPAWDKGVTDSCTSKIAESLYYSEFRRDPNGKDMSQLARVLTLGDNHFLMLKQDEADRGGRMYRFRVTHGIFQRLRLDPTMRKTFEKDYPNAPVNLKHDTVNLSLLDEKTQKLLQEIGDKAEYWEIDDQTLYNTLLNPLCKFDDRDLEALKNKSKAK